MWATDAWLQPPREEQPAGSRLQTESRATEVEPHAAVRVAPELGRHLVERGVVAEQDEGGVAEGHQVEHGPATRDVELVLLTVDPERALRALVVADVRGPHLRVGRESAGGRAPVQCGSVRTRFTAQGDAEHIHR